MDSSRHSAPSARRAFSARQAPPAAPRGPPPPYASPAAAPLPPSHSARSLASLVGEDDDDGSASPAASSSARHLVSRAGRRDSAGSGAASGTGSSSSSGSGSNRRDSTSSSSAGGGGAAPAELLSERAPFLRDPARARAPVLRAGHLGVARAAALGCEGAEAPGGGFGSAFAPSLVDECEYASPSAEDGAPHGGAVLSSELEPAPGRPWFGYLILAGCLAGLALSIARSGGIADLSANPMIGPSAAALVATGAKVTGLIICGDWWRLVSPMWLHAGLVHIAMNMNMLIRMGWPLERAIGTPTFAALYIASGVFSMTASAVFSTQSITVGASGALFGVLGAMLGELLINCHLLTRAERFWNFAGIILTIVVNLAIGLLPFLDNFAHVFGCLSGLLLGIGLIIHPDHRKGGVRFRQLFVGIAALAIWTFLFIVGIVWLRYNVDANALCPNCRYISCIPTPWWTCSEIPPAVSMCSGNVSYV